MANRSKFEIFLQFLADLTGLKTSKREMDATERKSKSMTDRMRAGFRGVRTGIGHVVNMFRRLRMVAVAAMAAAGAAIRENVVNTISLARAVNMFDGTIGTFFKFRREIRALSGDLGITQRELNAALYKIGSARIPKDNAIAVLRAAAKAFVADGASMASVIQGLAAVFGPFNIAAEHAGLIADKLYTIVKGGQTTFEEVATYLNQAATTAAGAGVSFDELAAAVTTLTAATIRTPTALVNIRNIMLALNKAMGEGWSETHSFQEAIEAFAKSVNYSQLALEKAFGRENMPAVLAMTGDNARKAAQNLDEMRNATGGALGQAAALVDQFRGWSRLWQTISGIVDRVGEVLDNTARPALEAITDKLAELRENDTIFQGLEQRLASMRDNVSGIVDYIANVEGGGAEVWEHVGGAIIGAWQEAVETAVAFLVTHAPRIGAIIGEAIKDSVFGVVDSLGRRGMAEKEVGGGGWLKAIGVHIRSAFDRDLNARVEAEAQRIKDDELAAEGKAAAGSIERAGREKREFHQAELRALATRGPFVRDVVDPPSQTPSDTPPAAPAAPDTPPAAPAAPARKPAPAGPTRAQKQAQLEQALNQYPGGVEAFRKEWGEAEAAQDEADRFRETGRQGGRKWSKRSHSYRKTVKELEAVADEQMAEAVEAQHAMNTIAEVIQTMSRDLGRIKETNKKLKEIEQQLRNRPEG